VDREPATALLDLPITGSPDDVAHPITGYEDDHQKQILDF
jgi:hypothetical protein